jgi:hypothetical protein
VSNKHDQQDEQGITENATWLKLFKQNNVVPSALIAFRLAQIPEEQEYDPNGDWNQGMFSFNTALGTKFDLSIYWDIKGKPYHLKLQEVHCAK